MQKLKIISAKFICCHLFYKYLAICHSDVCHSLQESASGSVGNANDTRPIQDTRPAGDTALAWPQNRRKTQTSDKLQNRGPLFPFEMEHM